MAIHESRLLWGKDTPIQTIISLGTGLYRKDQSQDATKDKISSTSLKEKVIKIVAGATDTESRYQLHLFTHCPSLVLHSLAVHTILKDVYDSSVYFRFQPDLSEDISIDESKPEKLDMLCKDAEQYVTSQEDVLRRAASSLMAGKTSLQKARVWWDNRLSRTRIK